MFQDIFALIEYIVTLRLDDCKRLHTESSFKCIYLENGIRVLKNNGFILSGRHKCLRLLYSKIKQTFILDVARQMNSFNQSECVISELCCYPTLKFIYNIDSWCLLLMWRGHYLGRLRPQIAGILATVDRTGTNIPNIPKGIRDPCCPQTRLPK